MWILFETHKRYVANKCKLIIPKSIQERTNEYLVNGCDLLGWFNECYEKTDESKDILKLKDVFRDFRMSDLKMNMTKADQRRFNYKYMCDFFRQNPFMRKYYKQDIRLNNDIHYRNILMGWTEKDLNDDVYNDEEDWLD